MTGHDQTHDAEATALCKACGLCCTGHLFTWAKLRPAELNPAEALGLQVFRSDPNQRGFSQPCPLWHGQCTIHASSHYPHVCRAYKCKLLKAVLADHIQLPNALTVIEQAQGLIAQVEALLPISTQTNFRERLVAQLESPEKATGLAQAAFRPKAEALLQFYADVFGVTDLLEKPAGR